MAGALRAQWPAQTADGADASDTDDGQLAEDLAAEAAIMNDPNLAQTVKEAIILARRGQGRFRKNVLHVESKCCLTGVTDPNHLIASHIKPWKVSTNDERLSADNGLMLGPHIDHLFDKGYIGFTDVGDLLVSPKCAPAVLRAWGISRSTNVRPFRRAQRPFLKYHRQHVFQG
jgi:predicted restriction endonuclease